MKGGCASSEWRREIWKKRSPERNTSPGKASSLGEKRGHVSFSWLALRCRVKSTRRAVGEWEGGLNYPKASHLQDLIGLCVQHHVFEPGREEEQIRALWKTAHQRVL